MQALGLSLSGQLIGDQQTVKDPQAVIQAYFKNFELFKKTNWPAIMKEGVIALETAHSLGRGQDEVKICAQLASTSFYLGNYPQVLIYADRCEKLAEHFTDVSPLIRALYLKSAAHRALAGKNQNSFSRAVEIAKKALQLYSDKQLNDECLKGKIYFNLGAAHADDPKGDLEEAKCCYLNALTCFLAVPVDADDDVIRTNIRLGKVYLLQKNYDASQAIIDKFRLHSPSERTAMQIDYLEAQLKDALNDMENALKVVRNGLARAKALKAKEDESRFTTLLENIIKRINDDQKNHSH